MIYKYLLLLILIAGLGAFFLGKSKALSVADHHGGIRQLHSLPNHYGLLTALAGLLPALIICLVWLSLETPLINARIVGELPPELVASKSNELSLVLNDIKNTISGNVTVTQNESVASAAKRYFSLRQQYRSILASTVIGLIVFATLFVYRRISPTLRARNIVEHIIKVMLMLCSGIAILTTLGIVFSVLFEAIRFFEIVPVREFLSV